MRVPVVLVLCGGVLASEAQVPGDGLVCFLPFQATIQDSSGNGHDAVASGGTYTTDRFGTAMSAIALNGISDSIRLPIPGFTPMTGDFSISFWLKTSSPEVLNILSIKDAPEDTVENFEMQLNSTYRSQPIMELYYASFTYWNGSGANENRLAQGSVGRYYNGTWQHYVLRRSGDSLQFWHDRYLLVETIFGGPLGDDGELVISAAPYRFDGSIDDIAIYDRALTSAEMVAIHHDRMPFELRSPTGTDAYVQGDTAFVFWRWDPDQVSDSVDLDFRVNGTGPWEATGQNQLVDWTPFRFEMDFPIGTSIELRLRDHLDTNLVTYSGAFIVSEYAWELVTDDLPFTERDGSGLLAFHDRLWLLGGWDPPFHPPNYTHSEVWSSADGIDWHFHGDAPWAGRHCSGWLMHDDAMWVIGGDLQSGCLRDVWRSDDGVEWELLLDTIPDFHPLRNSHMTASLNGDILNFGGQPAAYVPENLSQVWRSADGVAWEQLPDAPWKPRGMVLNSCVDDAGNLWLLGGGRLWDRRCYNDVWKTDDGINWEQVLAAAPWAPRYWHNVAWFDGKLWVTCGVVDQTNAADTWYSPDGVEWHQLMHPRYDARHASSVTVFDNALWQMAGIISNDCWRLRNVASPIMHIEERTDAQLHLYPNPTNGIVHVETDLTWVTLLTSTGLSAPITRRGNELDLSALPAGVYILSVQHSDGSMNNRRIVKL
ncbi:MAG TPA: T9SS type A sorting domain-containing protein [Flavobacteriales bacterium]|nr:T9SS type A sorting domain-containing protein [Flavobacteriales bacterium]